MSTVERVGRAISDALDVPHNETYGSYDYSSYPGDTPPYVIKAPGQREVIFRTNDKSEADDLWAKLEKERIAKAALNALADGLEFKADYLTLNGCIIGGVFASQHEGFRYDLFGSLPEKVFGSIEDAKQALMTAARKWLIGD